MTPRKAAGWVQGQSNGTYAMTRSLCRKVHLLALMASSLASPTHADWFGTGDNCFEIPFVTVGSPGNAADTTGAPNPAGRVDYAYRIGKFEVPEDAVRKANAQSLLDGAPLGITLDTRGPEKPATSLSWFEAARFVNWLNEDVGAAQAYKFDAAGDFQLWAPSDAGYNAANPFRNSLARYVLPSVDEWYKAAYYDPVADLWWDYPTGSDAAPMSIASGNAPGTAVWNQTTGPADVQQAGGESPFGTVGQGGNVLEWQENSGLIHSSDLRFVRGGTWGLASDGTSMSSLAGVNRLADFPSLSIGYRIVSVPEPNSAMIVGLSILGTFILRSSRIGFLHL